MCVYGGGMATQSGWLLPTSALGQGIQKSVVCFALNMLVSDKFDNINISKYWNLLCWCV